MSIHQFVVIDDENMGPVQDLICTLAELEVPGVNSERALVVTIEDPALRAMVERVVEASGRKLARLLDPPDLKRDINPAVYRWTYIGHDWSDLHVPTLENMEQIAGDFSSCTQDAALMEPAAQIDQVSLSSAVDSLMEGLSEASQAAVEGFAAVGDLVVEARNKKRGRPKKEAAREEKPKAAVSDAPCLACQQPFERSRANQVYCKRPECVKARLAKSNAEYQRRTKKRIPVPVQEMVADLAEEEAAVQPEVVYAAGGETFDLVEPVGVEAAAVDFADLVWQVEDGPRAGERLTNVSLRQLLRNAKLRGGQRLHHRSNGMHQVIKVDGRLRLKQLYGESAGQIVSV